MEPSFGTWKVQEGLRCARSRFGSAHVSSARCSLYSAVAVHSPAAVSAPLAKAYAPAWSALAPASSAAMSLPVSPADFCAHLLKVDCP